MLNKKRAWLSCLLIFSVLMTGCFKSKTVVTKVDPDTELKKLDGVQYSLPRTVVKATIPVKRTEEKPGPLEKLTPCFFPRDIADDRIRDKSISFSIEDPSFGYRVEPDPNEHYIVSVKGGLFEKKSLLLDYVPGGIISKGTAESTNESLEFTLKAIKTGTSIVAGIAGIPPGPEAAMLDTKIDATKAKARKTLLDDDEKNALDCYRKKYRIAKQETDEAQKAVAEATTKEAKDEAAKKLEKAKKSEETSKKELDTLETYLDAQANKRCELLRAEAFAEQEAKCKKNRLTREQCENEKAKIDCTNLSDEAKARTIRTRQRQGNSSTTGNGNSTSRSSEGEGNPFDQPTPTSTSSKPLPKRMPLTPEDYQAEKLLDDYQRAKDTFADIKELENRRLGLVSGNTSGNNLPTDTLKEMLTQINNTLEQRKALFFGVKTEKPWTGNFEYLPEPKYLVSVTDADGNPIVVETSRPLFWFAEKGDNAGLCPTPEGDKQGVIIPSKFKAKACGSNPNIPPADMKAAYLYLEKNTDDQPFRQKIAKVQAKFVKDNEKRGWYYRIPARATVRLLLAEIPAPTVAQLGNGALPVLFYGNNRMPADLVKVEEVKRSTLDIAQLGVTASAPASGSGRTNQSTLEYDDFGALKNFKYASDPLLQKSYLDDVQGTAQTVIDAKTKSNESKKAKADADAAANDPLTKKKRELELLETQNKINDEKKKLEEGSKDEEGESEP
jgi:hypothetical protein